MQYPSSAMSAKSDVAIVIPVWGGGNFAKNNFDMWFSGCFFEQDLSLLAEDE